MDPRILLVDDDPTFLAIAEGLVKSLAHVPVETANGPERALELLDAWDRGGVTALIVTDYIMPDMNGMDLIRASKELHAQSEFQYACLTTVFHRAVLARTKQAGAVRAEVKPQAVQELGEILKSIIGPWEEAFLVAN